MGNENSNSGDRHGTLPDADTEAFERRLSRFHVSKPPFRSAQHHRRSFANPFMSAFGPVNQVAE